MKKLLLTFYGISIATFVTAQCSVSIMQSPLVIPCNGSGTLTANVPVTDIDQPQNNTCMANFSQGDLAQSFVATGTTICGAGIFLTSGSGPATITIALYNLLPNVGGVLMASGTTTIAGPGVWADVTWPSTTLSVGNTYYLVFTSTFGGLCIAGSTSNPYSGGMVYANPGYGPFPSYDYTFHTFSCGGPVTYAWSTGGTTQTIPISAGGVYSVTVTVGACTASTTYTVVMAGPSSTITSTNISCNGGSNGSASVVASGGTGPYTYSWTPSGGTSPTASGLSANGYTCTVTDNNGCTTTSSVNITQPSPLVPNISSTPINCNGGTSTIVVSASGGTPAYTGTGTVVAGAGTYSYVIIDANGCTAPASVTVTQPAIISPGAVATHVSCNGAADGAVNQTPIGGTSPYTFNWNSGTYTTEDISGLAPGTYTCVITDANNCTRTVTVAITEPAVLTAAIATATNPTCIGNTNGAIDIAISGGTPTYTYLWSNAATTQDLTAVGVGMYSCSITDANGCTATANATLTAPAPPTVTFSLPIDTLCSTDGPLTLSGESPSGGTFSGTAVSAGAFDPATAGVGMHAISYTYTDSAGCNGIGTDSIYVDICMNVQSANSTPKVSIYPNPNSGIFNVMVGSGETGITNVYDMQGKLVVSQQIKQNTITTLSINEAGVYMVEILLNNGSRATERVVVTH